ncbi:unnamed protein product, partial [marine sediment metagenome]
DIDFRSIAVAGATETQALEYDTRSADTQVMVNDGETIFIGGLISETVLKEDHKIPILGDLLGGIPVIGNVFRYEQDNVIKTEVVFFVTVHIVKDGASSIADSKSTDLYEQYYPDKPILKMGKVEETKHEVSIATTTEPAKAEKKTNKPFLDFRKKKK